MRNVNRIPVFCAALEKIWKNYIPDFRFWQVINYMFEFAEKGGDPFFWEESDWMKIFENMEKALDKTEKV